MFIYLSEQTCLQQGREEYNTKPQTIIHTDFKIIIQNYHRSVNRKTKNLNENL